MPLCWLLSAAACGCWSVIQSSPRCSTTGWRGVMRNAEIGGGYRSGCSFTPTSLTALTDITPHPQVVCTSTPMFPHKQKSALVKKRCRCSSDHWWPGSDADGLLAPARQLATSGWWSSAGLRAAAGGRSDH
ncbi:class I SAM-dependent methyltransferase [Shigella flexneri]